MTKDSSRTAGPSPEEIVDFWRQAGPSKWFTKDPAFDEEFRSRFLQRHEEAAAGYLRDWAENAVGALALMILLDQFPRNSFRGTARVYATDPLAREYADLAIKLSLDEQTEKSLRFFFYLPFLHSENLADQDRSVQLHERLGDTKYAMHHRDIIRRFGRFPHRNAILNRVTTSEEQAYLNAGGFTG